MKTETLRCYDNGGKTYDRFTILPPRWESDDWKHRTRDGLLWQGIASCETPFHPMGFGMHIEAAAGSHLGKRVPFESLPADVRQFARQAFD